MDTAIVTLKLVLDELGVSPSIATLSDRKRVQKVVELVQGAGVDLGYTYGWYIRGPYSTGLTRDYFALDEAIKVEDAHPEKGYTLRPHTKEKLARIRPLLKVPDSVSLEQPEWLELLASLHYLQVDRKIGENETDELIWQKKQNLAAYLGVGRREFGELRAPVVAFCRDQGMTKRFADTVHGTVQLEDLEVEIVETLTFQRLRGIKQLGLASPCFPGADYSRFSHSIGACHVAQRLIEALENAGAQISPEHRRMYRVAGLLHDIGHYPFSHAMERAVEEHYQLTANIQTAGGVDTDEGDPPGGALSHERVGTMLISKEGLEIP